MSQEIIENVRGIARERGIDANVLLDALEDGLLAAYKKTPGSARHASVVMDDEGDYRVYSFKIPAEIEERLLDESRERRYDELEELEAEARERGEKLPPALVKDEELELDWTQVPEEQIERVDVTPEGFGRIAAMTARQVIQGRIREAERELVYDDYKDRIGEAVLGIVQQVDPRSGVYIDLGRIEALLPRSEQIQGERYDQNNRVRAIIIEVRPDSSGPQIILSRRAPELVAALFELEVPEIADGIVEIVAVARDPGFRAKVAVISHSPGVDPVGACVGPRGARVRPIVSELRGEKIDIIPAAQDPAKMLAKALSPARVREVIVDEEKKEATVLVDEDQRALAIGREGINVRLASRLTGWKIDVKSSAEYAASIEGQEDSESQFGRCVAILSSGKRCPNAALEGSVYCGIAAHQALEGQELPEATAADISRANSEEAASEEVVAVSAPDYVAEIGEMERAVDHAVDHAGD